MGKITGFMETARQLPEKRDARARLDDFREFSHPNPPERSAEQGGRCMDCGVPFCNQGCPLGNPIPDFNEHVYRQRWKDAFLALTATNNFPEFTGRLCPAPCEAACVLAINQDPVTIEQVEKDIIERAFSEGWVRPKKPTVRTGKRVAVVGSGPAGLAAAAQLNAAGHAVVVLERDDRLGGLLRYGIPDFKMEKWVLDRRLELMAAEGIEFKVSMDVGGKVSWSALHDEFDGVVVATGARVARELDVPGRELEGVVQAMAYLEEQNRRIAGDELEPKLRADGKRVVILGGGDTGSDCLGTSLRQGAKEVTQIELMPAPPPVRSLENPWPQWPLVFRTSSSQDEGGERAFARMTKSLSGTHGKLTAMHTVEVEWQQEPGRPPKLVEVPGSEQTVSVDLLILAMGFTGPDAAPLRDQLGVELDSRGNVKADARTFVTSVPGVYSAGDAKRGASLIVWAISEGREAARHLDAWLRRTDSALPSRGMDAAFGGR